MNLDFQAGKTPLTSRQNPVIYLVLVVALIVGAVFFGIWFIQHLRKKQMESPEFQEKEKSRATKKSDVKAFIQKYKLPEEYTECLWYVCKKFEIPNILFSIKSFDAFEDFFNQAYNTLKTTAENEKINMFFRLKFELDKIFANSVVYSSTRSIPLNTKMKLILKNNLIISSVLVDNAKDYIGIEVPQAFIDSEHKPEELDRIAFTFVSQTGLPYTFITRLIRYQKQGDKTIMIVNHSPHLMIKNQRSFKRKVLNEACTFSAVKVKKDENGVKNIIKGEKKYSGRLTNISGGGCCISSTLPIKEDQKIIVNFNFTKDPETEFSVLGKIVKSRKTSVNGVYNLHIQFIKIDVESQNKILAKVYGYDYNV